MGGTSTHNKQAAAINNMRVMVKKSRNSNSRSTQDRKLARSVVAPALDDELELSDMPQAHGCGSGSGGLHWDWSRIHRYNNNNNNNSSRTFVDLAALTCTFPDIIERKEAAADDDAKEFPENGWSSSHVRYDREEAAAAHGRILSSLDSEPDALPLLEEDDDEDDDDDDEDDDGEEKTHEILDNAGGMISQLPHVRTRIKPPQELRRSKNHAADRSSAAARKQPHKGSLQTVALKELPAIVVVPPPPPLPPPLQQQQQSRKTTTSSAATAANHEQETTAAAAHRTLSQKYRPQSFKEVEGQAMVVKALSSSVAKGKVAPVYLFMGSRGTGKTTMARIFAAALNCLSPPTEQRPCHICQACEDILSCLNNNNNNNNRSSCPDVKEVDASSNVDNIQGMRAMLGGFSPSHLRYKVIIVDGCDFLSTQVWNAFLKVLEEPPTDLVFILITTDAECLPLTVTSRCQKFPFCRLKEDDIVRRLKTMAVKEGLKVEEDALLLMASMADGSLRDAEMTMDQLSLLDRRISLSMVQELVGLVPDGQLLDLLDLALSAEAGNTVRFMRDLLKSGVEPLSLLSQLASLITNILAGSFDVHPETRRHKGFFRRNFSKKEEQQRLREALKVLSKAEKQLRIAASDQPTWLTAALLQFAPDRSFLPSSVNTSIAHSPVAVVVDPSQQQQKTTATTTTTTNRAEEIEEENQTSTHVKMEEEEEEASRNSGPPALGRTLSAYLENRKKGLASGAKVHPAATPLNNYYANQSELKLEAAWAVEEEEVEEEGVQGEINYALDAGIRGGENGSRLLRMMDPLHLEKTWSHVLQMCQSRVLKQLLQSHAQLIAVGIQDEERYAVAQVGFHHPELLATAERSERSIRHAFQMVLCCPVELRIGLERQLMGSGAALEEQENNFFEVVGGGVALEDLHGAAAGPRVHNRRQLRARKHRRAGANTKELQEIEKQNVVSHQAGTSSHRGHNRNRRRSNVKGEIGQQSWDSSWPQASKRYGSSSNSTHAGFSDSLLAAGSLAEAAQMGKSRRALLKTMMEEPQGELEETLDENWSMWQNKHDDGHTHVKSRKDSISNHHLLNASGGDRKSLKMESQPKPTRGGVLCWKALHSDKLKGNLRRRRLQGKAVFFRFVPCGKSNRTLPNNG